MKILGVLFIIAGVVLGLYVGVWVFFIGGIVNMVDGAKADPTNGNQIAWGAAEVFILAELVGGLVFWVCTAIGAVVFGSSSSSHRRSSGNRQVEYNWERMRNLP